MEHAVAKAWASSLASQLAASAQQADKGEAPAADKGAQVSATGAASPTTGNKRSDSCSLCVEIFGCPDCCEPVCGTAKAAGPASLAASPQQRLQGVYGAESDDAVWASREPFPGNSERIAAGVSGEVRDLVAQLQAARRAEKAWHQGYDREAAQLRAARAAVAQARSMGFDPQAASPPQALAEQVSHGGIALPFYELKGQGTRRALGLYLADPDYAFRQEMGRPVLASD